MIDIYKVIIKTYTNTAHSLVIKLSERTQERIRKLLENIDSRATSRMTFIDTDPELIF